MGHINPISLKKTLGLQSDIPLDKCEIYIQSKLTSQRNKEITLKPKVHLEKVVTVKDRLRDVAYISII